MKLSLHDELLFVAVMLTYRGKTISIPHVLVDTGSASTVLDADRVMMVGIAPEPGDRIRRLRGVGGHESVYERVVDELSVGERGLKNFKIEVGNASYGYGFGGILGLDFLMQTGSIIHLPKMMLSFGSPTPPATYQR